MTQHDRTERLLGKEALSRLRAACVTVFGLGGVGSSCVEALARSGLGHLRLVDHDTIHESNCNRQLHALHSTVGLPKAQVMKQRVLDIDPTLQVEAFCTFFAQDTANDLLEPPTHCVVDAIDAMGPKVELLSRCKSLGVPVISALGAGGRLDPTQIRVAPLDQTVGDPLAARVRKLLRRRGTLDGITAVYSLEPPRIAATAPILSRDLFRGRQRIIQPSMLMVPAAMGLAIAYEVIRTIALDPSINDGPTS